MNQADIFLSGEGDAWYRRNAKSFSTKGDLPLKLLELYGIKPTNALEIGCANGYRLAAIQSKYGSACTGLEPSEEAIADGTKRYPNVTFVHGVASEVPLKRTYDVIIIHFVLHWVDREDIDTVVNEVDRLLAPGGVLIIGDFYPDAPRQNQYHHLEDQDVKTYKEDYCSRFAKALGYTYVAHLSSSHSDSHTLHADAESNERINVGLLRKP